MSAMKRAALRCASSSSNGTNARLRFHVILNQRIKLSDVQQSLPGFRLTHLKLPVRGQCLYDGLRRLAHGPGPEYLYKPLLHFVMPTDVRRLIVLDTDVVVVRDVADLYDEFDRFGTAVLGIAREQTRMMEPLTGTNGGVQLLDLDRMRKSTAYQGILDRYATGKAGLNIGYLGDQTLYTFMFAERPDLFAWLPCEWNRQISAHFGFSNATVHECPGRCGIIHANYGTFKCIASSMQADSSCSAWKALADSLTRRSNATHWCPRAAVHVRAGFRHAMFRYFAECCTPDGVAFDAHGSTTFTEAEALKGLLRAKGIGPYAHL
jgi:hypothetical protein